MVSSPFFSDEELLRRVAGGDPAAYTVLYQRYHTRLSRFLASWLNDHRKTEDLTQEVLLEVWKSARTYQRGGSVGFCGRAPPGSCTVNISPCPATY